MGFINSFFFLSQILMQAGSISYPRINSVNFLGGLTKSVLQNCKFFLIHGNFNPISSSRFVWLDTFEHLSANNDLARYSGGVFNIQLNPNQTIFKIKRPDRMVSSSCGVVIIILPSRITEDVEHILTERLEKPLKNPVTIKNRDRYFILTEDKYLQSIFNSGIISSIKYKLALTEDSNGRVLANRFCSYCPLGPVRTFDAYPREINEDIEVYFPDLQKNYHGSVLKLSASDKLPGLIEMVKVGGSENNKYEAKRGVYAYALFHLVEKLNFTYDIRPSSGGGSTGHPLPNGTWVGTVGDAYNGLTDFGLVCGMTYLRFPVIELCATITYEYISFATGPAERLFTWKAIFWPFSPAVWIGLIVSILLAIVAAFCISKVNVIPSTSFEEISETTDRNHFGILSLVQYFGRTFIEQGDDLPVTLSQSIRVLLGWWLLFTLVAATAYKSKMVSFMTFPILEHLPDNFDQLAKSNYHIMFHYFGNVAYNTFRTSTNPTFVNIFNRMAKEPNPLNCLKQTMESKSACILFGITYDELRYRNLSNKFGDSPIKISPNYGFMFTPGVLHKKKAALSSNFKQVINSAMEMGLISQWQKTDLNEILEHKNTFEKETGESFMGNWNGGGEDVLHLQNLIGPFSVFIVGATVAIVLFIVEQLAHFKTNGTFFLDFSFLKENRLLNILSTEKKMPSIPDITISSATSRHFDSKF